MFDIFLFVWFSNKNKFYKPNKHFLTIILPNIQHCASFQSRRLFRRRCRRDQWNDLVAAIRDANLVFHWTASKSAVGRSGVGDLSNVLTTLNSMRFDRGLNGNFSLNKANRTSMLLARVARQLWYVDFGVFVEKICFEVSIWYFDELKCLERFFLALIWHSIKTQRCL